MRGLSVSLSVLFLILARSTVPVLYIILLFHSVILSSHGASKHRNPRPPHYVQRTERGRNHNSYYLNAYYCL